MPMYIGITSIAGSTQKKKAAQVLIAKGVTFDKCDDVGAGTILYLKHTDYNLPNQAWARSMRLDNQGNINNQGKR